MDNNRMTELTHIDKHGNANMVDVGDKVSTDRVAIAIGSISMKAETLKLINDGTNKKGDVLAVSRIAGIQAAKTCFHLIPLCHPLMLTSIELDFEIDHDNYRVLISSTCKVSGQTGVEMEALTAVSIAALTIYDMCKAVDKEMIIGSICLVEKSGGKSGHFRRE